VTSIAETSHNTRSRRSPHRPRRRRPRAGLIGNGRNTGGRSADAEGSGGNLGSSPSLAIDEAEAKLKSTSVPRILAGHGRNGHNERESRISRSVRLGSSPQCGAGESDARSRAPMSPNGRHRGDESEA